MKAQSLPSEIRNPIIHMLNDDHQTLFAYLSLAPLSIEDCTDLLGIQSPLEVVKSLNTVGEDYGFQINIDKQGQRLSLIRL